MANLFKWDSVGVVKRMDFVVLFDGHCTLCHGTVVFLIRRDPEGIFTFASLQSEAGKALLAKAGYDGSALDSIVFIEHGRVFDRSTAALRIARKMNRLWPLFYGLIIVPRPIRDAVYNWIARNRYAWFGRVENCLLPTPEIRSRFIEYIKAR